MLYTHGVDQQREEVAAEGAEAAPERCLHYADGAKIPVCKARSQRSFNRLLDGT